MSYLIPQDYNRLIQDPTLQQIISGNQTLVSLAENASLSEIISYLVQKYDTSREFTSTLLFNPGASYKANNRIYIDAAPYDPTKTYALNALCLQTGQVYICSIAIITPESFDPASWTLLGNEYDMYYVQEPFPEFNLEGTYNVGDEVWWKDHTYTAVRATNMIDHDMILQFVTLSNQPYSNVFPDDPNNGQLYWTDNGLYTVLGTSILDILMFTTGDNRNQQMVEYMIDMVIYRLYKRISPKDIPQGRRDAYSIVLGWLKECAKGTDITANLVEIQPPQGSRIRYAGNVKNINSY